MKIWKNTGMLDAFLKDTDIVDRKDIAQVAVLGSKPIKLSEFPSLKGIFRVGAGTDNVPFDEAAERGVKVGLPAKETIDVIYTETADFTCGLIFRMLYDDPGSLEQWKKYGRKALCDKTLLVIGMGNIGGRVAGKMKNFMKVEGYDISRNRPEELLKMLSHADCVTLHIPNIPGNKDFMDKQKLSLMKDGAVLINTARGALVCEDALYSELKKGRLYAAFDVFWQEPYSGKLKEFHPGRFYMTPHAASTCDSFLEKAASDLKAFISGLDA